MKKPQIKSVVCSLAEFEVTARDWQWKCRQIVEVFNDAIYQFTTHKANKETESKLEKISITAPENEPAAAQAGLFQGKAIAEGMN